MTLGIIINMSINRISLITIMHFTVMIINFNSFLLQINITATQGYTQPREKGGNPW